MLRSGNRIISDSFFVFAMFLLSCVDTNLGEFSVEVNQAVRATAPVGNMI
jgi:hypothetical protein